MINGVIAAIHSLEYLSNDHKHTVIYARQARELASRSGWRAWEGNVRAGVAATMEEAAAIAGRELWKWMSGFYWAPRPEDFTYCVVITEIKDGKVWLNPCTHCCGILRFETEAQP